MIFCFDAIDNFGKVFIDSLRDFFDEFDGS